MLQLHRSLGNITLLEVVDQVCKSHEDKQGSLLAETAPQLLQILSFKVKGATKNSQKQCNFSSLYQFQSGQNQFYSHWPKPIRIPISKSVQNQALDDAFEFCCYYNPCTIFHQTEYAMHLHICIFKYHNTFEYCDFSRESQNGK